MSIRIHIPKVDRNERIGSVFNELFKVINVTENAKEIPVVWDFRDASFFHPFFPAPLAIYKGGENAISFVNVSPVLSSYFNLIHFDSIFEIKECDDLYVSLSPYISRTYTPICKFSLKDEKNVDNMQSVLQHIIQRQSNYGEEVHTPLSYMLGELVCDMSQHSRSDYGYIYAQLSRHDGCINLCLADDGITIHGSYIAANKYTDKIGGEADALKLANTGYSTKGDDLRGFGISSTRKLLVEGMNGSFFMLSGDAFYRHERGMENYVELPQSIYRNGTVILLKIPISIRGVFDLYRYIY